MAALQTLASPGPKTLDSSPMVDLQTPASPDLSSASTKKKKKNKKRKAIEDAAASLEKDDASPEKADAAAPKKKKKSKKSKIINDAAAPEPEPINVTVDASLTGGSSVGPENDATAHEKSAAAAPEKKKKSKKRKVIDDAAAPEKDAAAPEKLTAAAPEKKKKKKSKKTKVIDDAAAPKPEPINVTVDASLTGGSSAAAPEPEPEPEPINVTVDASLTGGSSAAPAVAYFPSGYDPLAASEAPSARLYRNAKHPSWIDLVVRSPCGGPDFVGKSYEGEACMPQLCNYALGVLDKASGTLKVVPVASDKILRLQPYVQVQKPAHSQISGVASEAGSAVATDEMKVQDLTSLYGTQKDKEKDKKWRSLIEQRNDPSAYVGLDLGELETNANASDKQAPAVVRNIPPYDPTANTSETAYRFDEIIPKNIRSYLLEILGHLESGEFSSKGYGSFVSNRVHKLENLQGEDKERLAMILSYITHLLTLLARNSSMSKRHKKEAQATKAPLVPQAVYRNLLVMFTEEGSSALSTEKKELLINYILVLTLFADDFRSDPTDITADLKMTRQMLKPYYEQLGCKSVSAGAFQPSFMTLPAPLNFPKEVTRRKRRR